jgi:hypothetical protein
MLMGGAVAAVMVLVIVRGVAVMRGGGGAGGVRQIRGARVSADQSAVAVTLTVAVMREGGDDGWQDDVGERSGGGHRRHEGVSHLVDRLHREGDKGDKVKRGEHRGRDGREGG